MKISKLALSAAIASALTMGTAQAHPESNCECANGADKDRSMSMNDAASGSAAGAMASDRSDDRRAQAADSAENVTTEEEYEEIYAKGISVDDFLDANVVDAEGDVMGEVEDLIIGADDNRITGMVIETGGFLEIGDSHLLYPFDKAQIKSSENVQVGNIDGEHVEELSLYRDIEGDSVGNRWRVTEMIGAFAYANGDPYGRIDDVIIDRSGDIMAVIVQPDVMYDDYGYYAWPYEADYYDADEEVYEVPIDKRHVFGMTSFDRDRMEST